MITETQEECCAFVESLPITFNYICKRVPPGWENEAFEWQVLFHSADPDKFGGTYIKWTTYFYMGLAHIHKPKVSWAQGRPKPPTKMDVMYSLMADAMAGDMNFNQWCDELGYSSDSIKAFDTYRECLKVYETLHKLYDRDTFAKIKKAVEDY